MTNNTVATVTTVNTTDSNTTEIVLFNNPDFGQVRTLMIDGEPWFVGKDIAEVLDYNNPLKALRMHVDEEDKGVNKMFTPGGNQNVIIINESGLYSLILKANLLPQDSLNDG